MTAETARYLSCAETAKLVRKALRERFPGVRFSVRSHTYAGGASIHVKWTDGPRTRLVEPVAKQYQGGGFDGSIDMMHYASHYLRPDGRVMVAYASGTQGSAGYVPSTDNRDLAPVLPADAELVRFGADFIFCDRERSNLATLTDSASAWLREHCRIDEHPGRPDLDRFGNEYVANIARAMAYDSEDGEGWADVFDRRHGEDYR